MLQIITGKFFKTDDRHLSEGKGVLHSNYRWFLPIETSVGHLEPLDTRSAFTTYLYAYTNQLEKRQSNFELVRVGDGKIIEQFRLLCVFGLRAMFAEDRSWVAHLCRPGPVGQSDESAPTQLLPRYFDSHIDGNIEEAKKFTALVAKVLSLSRSDFLSIITALQAFSGALEVVGTNLNLAYSMLVYALESLSQKYIKYEPHWMDFNEKTRRNLDRLLAGVSEEVATNIRAALIDDAHLKLRAGFTEFICSHVDDSFFIVEAEQRSSPLQHCELRRAARNIYDVRSAYVHELTPLMHQLSVPQIAVGDVFRWDNEPHLTFCGVVRLADHVIRTLISRLPPVAKEDFNWRASLPGTLRLHVAPQYWIHQAKNFHPSTAHSYFAGFLDHFLAVSIEGGAICNMNDVMAKIEENGSQGKQDQRRSMLALYFIYNECIQPKLRRPNWEAFLESQKEIVSQPCIEIMAACISLNGKLDCTASEIETALIGYQDKRFHRGILRLSPQIECALDVVLANQALHEGLSDKHRYFLRNAILNSPGRPQVQRKLQEAIDGPAAMEMNVLLPHLRPPETPDRTEEVMKSAYFKFLNRTESGQVGDALSDWLEAENETV